MIEPNTLWEKICLGEDSTETLASLLARCPIPVDVDWIETTRNTFMDRHGEGVPIILARSEALSGRLPEYRVIDHQRSGQKGQTLLLAAVTALGFGRNSQPD